jgi:crotonobetainyl-CoA:carnitine CoA-transferase CaiB-like acyl-CoA transferase
MNKPLLSGVRILDLTTVIMGPFATHILADLGADVIKVEPPEGDSMRSHPPHGARGITGSFLNLNRNKRSVVLDLKSDAGRNAFELLLESAEVVVHNLRAPVMARLGFDYARCKAIKPDIIYCAAYGFSAQGPYAAKPAYDDMIQAASGFAALATPIAGSPNYAPSVICDKLVGQAVANAILAALFHRERTGEGQEIEVPMFETAIEFNLMEAFSGAAFQPRKGPPGYARISMPERRPFRTADGYACILPYSDRNWQDFFAFVGRHDLLDDPRFLRLADRSAHFPFLYSVIHEEAPKRSTAQWIDFCDGANIPCMPVIDLADIEDDQHVKAVGLFAAAKHPHAGEYRLIRRPASFSAAEFELRHHAPLLGEHSRSVLEEAGLAEEALDAALRVRS